MMVAVTIDDYVTDIDAGTMGARLPLPRVKRTSFSSRLTSVPDPKLPSASEAGMSAFRPKRTKRVSAKFDRSLPQTDTRYGANLQPQRSRQLVEQRLRLLQIGRVKPLGEPAVDRAPGLAVWNDA